MNTLRVKTPQEIIKQIIENTPCTCFIVLNHLLLRHMPSDTQSVFYISSKDIKEECEKLHIKYEEFMSHLRSIIISGRQNGWIISKDHLDTLECKMMKSIKKYEE